MTATYDPHHPMYLDEAQTRTALAQAFDVCNGCRKCVDLCPSFPTMFRYVSQGGTSDAGQMTPAQQDHVIDECFQCKLCVVGCPYGPGQQEMAHDFVQGSAPSFVLDIPRLMLRADAMRYVNGHVTVRDKLSTALIGHADLVGKLSVRSAKFINRLVGAKPGSLVRRLLAVLTGIASNRALPLFAELRFSAWFGHHPKIRVGKKQGRVTVYPTCVVEFQQPAIGQALVRVYEHNGIECGLSKAACCGAGYLHSGNLAAFTKVAVDNVATLAAEVRKGNAIVVPQTACGYVLKHDYIDYVGGPDAQLVGGTKDVGYDGNMSRLQLALNVDHLDDAIAHYTKVFGVGPAKVRPGYANFAIVNPPLKLVLIENPGADDSVNHLGVEVESVDEVRAAHDRVTQTGLPIFVEGETTCCYAVQDKFWIEGGEHRFEVYTVLADADQMQNTPKSADARPVADAVEQPAACCAPTRVSC